MPQAARFRVFAYFYTPGIAEPYKVMELKPSTPISSGRLRCIIRREWIQQGAIIANTPPP